jgi:hypothetical protein
MSMEDDWIVVLQCKSGHRIQFLNPRLNVDGHAVVPVPKVCPSCVGEPREPTRLELRRFKKELKQL